MILRPHVLSVQFQDIYLAPAQQSAQPITEPQTEYLKESSHQSTSNHVSMNRNQNECTQSAKSQHKNENRCKPEVDIFLKSSTA